MFHSNNSFITHLHATDLASVQPTAPGQFLSALKFSLFANIVQGHLVNGTFALSFDMLWLTKA